MTSILVDTGVWYAIFDPRDRPAEREAVSALAERIQSMTAIVPWPIAYETMSSRFAKNKLALQGFERLLKSRRIEFLDDAPYREFALQHSFESSLRCQRPLSLTDCLLRVVIDDPSIRISYFATFNVRDFADVCARNKLEMLP